jgi:TetR/AcrR family tetracycline transcriptional repressor
MSETMTRRPGPRRALSEDDILAAGMGLLDGGGAAALSMRAVAGAVGVAPNALYTYFPTKTALLHALTDELLGQVDHRPLRDPALAWRDRLTRYALDLRATLLAHPGSAALVLRSPFEGPHARATTELLRRVFDVAGLAGEDGARATSLLMTSVLGAVAFDAVASSTSTDQYLWGLGRLLDGLERLGGAPPA